MFIYNESSETFIKKLRVIASSILNIEMGLNYQKRVLHKHTYYPLSFVVFENAKKLGFYDPVLYQVGINKELMLSSEEIIENVLRHELAHFFVHINYGVNTQAHGREFKEVFTRFKWSTHFSKAQIDIDQFSQTSTWENSILNKVKKLLSLAESTNQHEAQLATKKANDLITKHNLQSVGLNTNSRDIDDSYVLRVAQFKRRNALHDAIYEILKSFNVYPVFNQGKGGGYLEVIGSRSNVEIAEYMASYLERSIEQIWKQIKKDNPQLKGSVAKNSFIRGFSTGVCQALSSNTSLSTKQVDNSARELMRSELLTQVQRVYPRLSKSYSSAKKNDAKARNHGLKSGREFEIKKGISQGSKLKKLLNW